MKLITERSDSVEIVSETTESGEKKTYIQGVFMQSVVKNRNGRIYEQDVLKPAVNTYVENFINKGRAVGELNHPDTPTVNLDRVSHRIVEMSFKDADVHGKALVLNTPMGNILNGLLEGGVQVGVSSRGMGNLDKRSDATYVKPGFILSTVDVVHDPSAPAAFVEGILEHKDWMYENGILTAREIDQYETEVKRLSTRKMLGLFEDFLSKL